MKKDIVYVTKVPEFNDLANLRDDIKHVSAMLTALSPHPVIERMQAGNNVDVSQRASNLLTSIEELYRSAKEILTLETENA